MDQSADKPLISPASLARTDVGGGQDVSAPTRPAARRWIWSDWLLAALLFGSALSIPLVYLVMDYPGISRWVGLYNGSLGLGALVLSLLIWYSPHRIAVPVIRARQIRGTLLLSVIGLESVTFAFLWPSSSNGFISWRLMSTYFAWLVVAIMALAIFAGSWRKEITWLERKLSPGAPVAASYVLGITLLLASLFLWPSMRPFKIARPAASWQLQLQVAEQAAHKLDSEAVLSHVRADPSYEEQADFNLTLRVTFYFDTPSGKRIAASLRDSDPEVTVDAYDGTGTIITPVPVATLAAEKQLWSTVKISPRDAFDKTVPDAALYLGAEKGTFILDIYAREAKETDASNSPTSRPIQWNIQYQGRDATARYDISYDVDSSTGIILHRQLDQRDTP